MQLAVTVDLAAVLPGLFQQLGIRNVVSVLTTTIAPQQLIRIATLMKAISCEAIDFV